MSTPAKHSSLEQLRVASPCTADWSSMQGDAHVRHCQLCGHSVYDLSSLTRAAAEQLISSREGRTCVRLYRRADGTVMTRDCPRGLRAVRRRLASVTAGMLGLLVSLLAAPALGSAAGGSWSVRGGLVRIQHWLQSPFTLEMGMMICEPAPLNGTGAAVPQLPASDSELPATIDPLSND